jgi:hypothetical protein
MSILSNGLTTVARLKTFAGINDNSQDTLIERLINAVTEFVEQYTSRSFLLTNYSNELYDGSGTDKLVLKQAPISAVTLSRRDSASNLSNFSVIEAENYFIKSTSGILQSIGFEFIRLPLHYRVSYTAGYDYDQSTKTLESVGLGDLEYAVWKLIQGAIYNRKDNPTVQSETIGNYSVTFRKEAQMNAEIKTILDSYLRPEYA